jgi:anaerobic selenocysteine-containing dehydrogenase
MACVPSTCPFCACGCGLLLQEEDGRLLASFPSSAPPARSSLCIRGWHCTSPVSAADRLATPLIRRAAGLVRATWQEAVSEVTGRLCAARVSPLFAVGPTVASEDAAAVQRLAGRIGGRLCTSDLTGAVTARSATGRIAPGTRGLSDPEAISSADLLWVIGLDAADCPQVAGRVIEARRRGATVVRFDVHVAAADGSSVLTRSKDRIGELAFPVDVIAGFRAASRPVVIVGGRWLTSEGAEASTVALLRTLASLDVLDRVVFAAGESNSWGVLDLLGADAPAAEVACRDENLETLIVVADDIVRRSPRPTSMAHALSRLASLVVIDRFPTETTALADVVLPSCTFAEADGSVTSLFGEVHAWRRVVPPPGAAVPERTWMERIGAALDLASTSSTTSASSTSSTLRLGAAAPRSGQARTSSTTSTSNTSDTRAFPTFPFLLLLSSHPAAFSTGVLSSRDEILRREAIEPVLMVSPGTLKAVGLKPGWPARLVVPDGEATVAVRADRGLPDAVLVLVPLPGSAAANLRGWYPEEGGRSVGLQPVPARLERA